ncbi:RCC1 domain-containing protein 1 isoform X2 [Pseudophryne corroboree]|uniref:RCC1 domain-containing protein 1 isoform X2 n=1 Tax=Pseudophryne corroboree TaxID=495146 RepID=UPI003081D148
MPWFGFGYSGFGQLGLGEERTVNLPKPLQINGGTIESNKQICRVVPAWSYSAVVTEDGSLLLSGLISGCPKQHLRVQGLDCSDILPSEKYLILLLRERAECWDINTIDVEGTLPKAMWKMELPVGHDVAFPLVAKGHVFPQPPFFRELPATVRAQKMALGNEHAVLLTSDGKVLTWGAGRHGQLGHEDVEDVSEPRIVEALHGVSMGEVAAGGWHTACISEGGDIYCWGWNESGQLGLPSRTLGQERMNSGEESAAVGDGEFIAIQSFPALIDLPQDTEASKISCGSRHTATVTRKYGQLGHGDTTSLDHPKRAEFFPQNNLCVKDVTCRYWNTYVLCLQETK